MGSKDSLLNRFDHWLHDAPPSSGNSRPKVEMTHREPQITACTGHHRRPPFYLRWWLGAHRD